MNKKRMRPLTTNSPKKRSTKLRQKWWPIVILAAFLIGYLIWKNNSSQTNTTPIESTPSTTEQDNGTAAQSNTTPLDNDNNTSDNTNPTLHTDDSTNTDSQIPDPEVILNAPLPETDSLAKEEIDRLEDERRRLAEQEKLAAEQLTMNKQLTEMKAEQIALLEQQIAQLEASESAKNSVR
ncbi:MULTISPECIES: hypothetical protein [unclassified Psychrobacter]|uniref:hypothetical protein n=1 Tax=unclassified Psychrobacter TaxID=196806 RepID=UPI0025CF44BF|nr:MULTISPECIES: hypothetical protein [unclassified Psychrobacter]